MSINNIMSLLGGIALFLFGMSVMGDSLKKVAGSRMEMVLYKLAGNPLKAILLGTGVTAVIQSSSATSVMVVGFVNSGMMKVRQAIGVILGAVLGTSITGWVLCLNSIGGSGANLASVFSTEVLTGLVALIGIVLWMVGKTSAQRQLGGILLGFAVLMYGMSAMSGAIGPLRTNESFIHFLTNFSNPVVGVLAGLVLTAVIQSASAAVGILQALAVTGAIEFNMALPIILGIGIGASVPVILSAFGAGTNGKRSALVYLIINLLGAILFGNLFYGLNAVFHFSFMTLKMNMVSIALTNSLYRFLVVLLLAPLIGVLERIVRAIFPERGSAADEQADVDRLEPRFLLHPAISITQSRDVINSMAEKTLDSVVSAVALRRQYSKTGLKRVFDLESIIDRYEDKLGAYLVQITASEVSEAQSREVNHYLRALSDFERISDHARNIGEAVEETEEKRIIFSNQAAEEITVLENAVIDIMQLTIEAFTKEDIDKALKIDPLEEVIDDLCDRIKSRHVERVGKHECTIENGFVFNDLLTDYERIADHCSNIAVNILETSQGRMEMHEYHLSASYGRDVAFKRLVEEYMEKYSV